MVSWLPYVFEGGYRGGGGGAKEGRRGAERDSGNRIMKVKMEGRKGG